MPKRDLMALQKKDQKSSKLTFLECVYCGYCVEACPCDAIRMDTGIFSFTGGKREDFVVDKEHLMSNERSKDFDDE
ncbi:MAG: 4Fe-4S binding protein [Halarcobacter sp.]